MKAAAVNAAFACRGERAAAAILAALEEDDTMWYNFGAIGTIYQEAGRKRVGCIIVRHAALQKAVFECDARASFSYVASMTQGVWIVRLLDEGFIDHAVVLDCDKQIIVDSEESCAIALTATNLFLCGGGGGGSKKLRVTTVREVVAATEAKW